MRWGGSSQHPDVFYRQLHSGCVYQKMAAGGDANSKGPFVASLFRQITWMTMLPFFLVGIGGDRIFGLVFGENWLEAGVYCQILSFSLFINFI